MRQQLSESHKSETILRNKCDELTTQLDTFNREGKLFGERVARLRHEKEEAILKADDKDIQLKAALEKIAVVDDAGSISDAHVWWAYVWHELRRQEREEADVAKLGKGMSDFARASVGISVSGSANSRDVDASRGFPGSTSTTSNEDKQTAAIIIQSNQLKENLRAQAVEIASLRQVNDNVLWQF